MKQFIFGVIIGGAIATGTTYYVTKKEIEKRTISKLREELLESCMAEARRTIEKEEPLKDEDLPFEPDNKGMVVDEEVPFEDPEKEKEVYENITKNYARYYKKDTSELLVYPKEGLIPEDEVATEEDRESQSLSELAELGDNLSKTDPYEIIDEEDFHDSEWNKIYDQETLVYHIPDMCLAEDTGNILGEDDILDMLGPEYQRELAARGKAFIRNHKLQTTYEVYATEISYADTNRDDEEDEQYDDEE